MSRKITLFLMFFMAGVLEVSLAPVVFPWHVSPDVILVFLVIWLSKSKLENFWGWIVTAGVISDILTVSPIGVHVISFTIVGFFITSFSKRFFVTGRTDMFFPILLSVWGATAVNFFVSSLIARLAGYAGVLPLVPLSAFFFPSRIFFLLIGNAIVFFAVYWMISKLKSFFLIGERKLAIK